MFYLDSAVEKAVVGVQVQVNETVFRHSNDFNGDEADAQDVRASRRLYHVVRWDQGNNMLLSEFIRNDFSFPFDRAGRLRADIVNDAVYSLDFGHDSRGHARQQIVRQPSPISRHAIDAGDGSYR